MAQIASHLKFTQRELLEETHIVVKIPRTFGVRLWIGTRVMKLGALIVGVQCDVKMREKIE